MIFHETKLTGAFLIELEKQQDERGFFARSWCQREFESHGLNTRIAQCNVSYNKTRGILRGMHFQNAPYHEAKLVRCTRGSIFDVIIDLRKESPTYTQQVAEVLTRDNHKMLYVPEGFAHGFQALEDDTEVFYQMSEFYVPAQASGVRWNDPAFAIQWPIDNPIMIARDQNYPDFIA